MTSSRRTRTFRRSMRCIPRARVVVATVGRPSGTAATASEIDVRTIWRSPAPRRRPSPRVRAESPRVSPTRFWPRTARLDSSGVTGASVSAMSARMRPSSVRRPVAVTSARPLPSLTTVPANTTLSRSATGVSSGWIDPTTLRTGKLSPVSADSLTVRGASTSMMRPSACTSCPARSTMMSPGTSEDAGTRLSFPSRRTGTTGEVSCWSDVRIRSTRLSVT